MAREWRRRNIKIRKKKEERLRSVHEKPTVSWHRLFSPGNQRLFFRGQLSVMLSISARNLKGARHKSFAQRVCSQALVVFTSFVIIQNNRFSSKESNVVLTLSRRDPIVFAFKRNLSMEGGALPIRLFEFLVVFITVKALDSKGRKMFNTNSIF